MISKIISVSNEKVTVCFSEIDEVVCVFDTKNTTKATKTFAGFDQLRERFNELYENFSEDLDLNTAIDHFKTSFSIIKL